jgi:hypothetical protein
MTTTEHTSTFDATPRIGERVTGRGSGPGYTSTWSGVYDGIRPSEWDGVPHHWLRDGEINGIAQRVFTFPVSHAPEPSACPKCGSTDTGVFAATVDREDEADLVECEDCHWLAPLTIEGAQSLEQSRTGPDADFVGAGDDVVILNTRERGVLVDVEGDEACVRLADGSNALTYTSMIQIAHPDSPAATA